MSDRPSILILMTDQQRRDSLGVYGCDWAHTPNLDRLGLEGGLEHELQAMATESLPTASAASCETATQPDGEHDTCPLHVEEG